MYFPIKVSLSLYAMNLKIESLAFLSYNLNL